MSILRAVFEFLCGILLGCRHDRVTRPFTIEQETYKVCLDCGKHIFYSADTMRPLRGRELHRIRAVRSGELKVVPVAAGPSSLNREGDSRAVA